MPRVENIIVPKNFKVLNQRSSKKEIVLDIAYVGPKQCPYCGNKRLRNKGPLPPQILRHGLYNNQVVVLMVYRRKYRCYSCGKYFHERVPETRKYSRAATESFKRHLASLIMQGRTIRSLSKESNLSENTLLRYLREYLYRKTQERKNAHWPLVIGIDEKWFNKVQGYVTVVVDFERGNRLFDMCLGRSTRELEQMILSHPGRERVRYVFCDLSPTNKALVRKYFPHAQCVADRFHVISMIQRHFMWAWSALDAKGRKNRALSSLMRYHYWNLSESQKSVLLRYLEQHPFVAELYRFKQELTQLMLQRVYNTKKAKSLVRQFLDYIEILKSHGGVILQSLAKSLESWSEEMVRMWRFSRTNSITEGINRKLQGIMMKAYGMRNFSHFRLLALATTGDG